MLFNSYIFVLFFLPVCLLGYFGLNRFRCYKASQLLLLVMSLWFYGYFNPSYLTIILASIVINYTFNLLFQKLRQGLLRKAVFAVAVAFNIGILFYFKYFDFFMVNVSALVGADYVLKNILLPLGISFFTFQQLSYVIDCYRGEVPNYDFLQYASFVVYFPQLIAGPIVTHDELVPQFNDESKKRFNWDNMASGLYIFALGLGKKVLIADIFGGAANWGFANVADLDSTNAWLAMLAYTIQIYFDFSGYCDMAIGIGRMMNIDLPLNFDSPYKAITISDFWGRWHKTLTRFFTKYLYIPLGGSRRGLTRTCINTMVVFLVSGIWHGANWTFIVWGCFHGIAMVVYKVFKKHIDRWPRVLNWVLTFLFVNAAWVLFRADSLAQAFEFLGRVAAMDFGAVDAGIFNAFEQIEMAYVLRQTPLHGIMREILLVGHFLLAFGLMLGSRNAYEKMCSFKPGLINMAVTVGLLVWCVFSFAGISTFLYFNF